MAYPFVLIILILNRLVAGLHSASLLSLKPWTCLSKRVSSYKPSGKYSEPTLSYHSTTGLPFLLSYIHCKNALEREPKLEELPISLLTWMSRSNPDLRYNLSGLDILAYESPVGIWYLGIQCKSEVFNRMIKTYLKRPVYSDSSNRMPLRRTFIESYPNVHLIVFSFNYPKIRIIKPQNNGCAVHLGPIILGHPHADRFQTKQ